MRNKWLTSLQLAAVGLVFLHDLSDLLSFQRGVQHLVQPGVSLPAVDEVHQLVQRDERLPLGAAGAKRREVCALVSELQSVTKNRKNRTRASLRKAGDLFLYCQKGINI